MEPDTTKSLLSQKLIDSTYQWLSQAKPLLRSFARITPEIMICCDLRGKSAGQLQRYSDGRLVIRYNLAMAELQPEEFIRQTVPHEVAHLITWVCYGKKAKPHGKEWRSVMTAFGIDSSDRCHNFTLAASGKQQRGRWLYSCDCQQHTLSSIRHNRILKGQSYLCRRCHNELKLTSN